MDTTQISIRIDSTDAPDASSHRIDITIPKRVEAFSPLLEAAASPPAERWQKVLADYTTVPGSDLRTDHVAVIDHETGLMWSVESLGSTEDADDSITQDACAGRCASLALLGHRNWRLPTRAELAGLVDDTRTEPAIDTSLFPRVKPRLHWTSTPHASSASDAWSVFFYYGLVGYDHRDVNGFALAVRRAGQ